MQRFSGNNGRAAGEGHPEYPRRPRPSQAQSLSALPRIASEESWIEVSSQPSSSSLSSAADEIITTGLRVQHGSTARRRRRLRRSTTDHLHMARRTGDGTGSQDEYDESESESDRVMSSSNEGLQHSPVQEQWQPAGRQPFSSASSDNAYASNEDEDEEATAIGIQPTGQDFVPRPNAFTMPQSQPARSQPAIIEPSLTPQRQTRPPAAHRHSYQAQTQHSPYNVLSPHHQADHDAALRASLSTLLSCAAAARGLPKSTRSGIQQVVPSNRIDTTTLRMVPESVALGTSGPASTAAVASSDPESPGTPQKVKRKAGTGSPGTSSAARSSSKDRRAVKKARRASPTRPMVIGEVSPTLMTWVVSAGVVVLVSAISFSAGYVYGKEIGRAEASGLGNLKDVRHCGRDALLEGGSSSLKRLKWTGTAGSVRA